MGCCLHAKGDYEMTLFFGYLFLEIAGIIAYTGSTPPTMENLFQCYSFVVLSGVYFAAFMVISAIKKQKK